MNEILQSYLLVVPNILEAFDKDIMMSITDGHEFLGYWPGKKLRINVQIGDPLKREDTMYECFHTGKIIRDIIPKKLYGFSFRSIAYPIYDEAHHIIGTMGIAMSLEEEENLAQLFNEMKFNVNEIREKTDMVNSLTNEVTNKVEVFEGIVEGIKRSTEEMKNSAQGIKSIASQSNILSLNASIEAARAGEAGKSFAVVAAQMQKLSNNSRSSSEQVLSLLTALQTDVFKINTSMQELMEAFSQQGEESKIVFEKISKLEAIMESLSKNIKNF